MIINEKSAPFLYAEFTGTIKPFVEIWKEMYFRRFKPSRGHWISPPSELPNWFYEEFRTFINEQVDASVDEFDLRGDPTYGSSAVDNLRMEYDD